MLLDLAHLKKPLDFTELFGRQAPVEIEVGIGSGYFLSRYASEHPGLNLLGMDKAGTEVMRTLDKCRRREVENVRLLRCDAIYFLHDYPPDSSINAYHVYYSDPWPKKRHHKRRLWRAEFLQAILRTLKPEGKLFLKTDVSDYYLVIQEVIRAAGGLELIEDRRLDQSPIENDYQTNFQRKAIEQGHPLHYQIWTRRTQ